MATYVSIFRLREFIAVIRKLGDFSLPVSLLEIMEFADKETKSIQEFVERLDSSARMRMNASLQQMAAATREFEDVFKSYVSSSDENEIQDLKQKTHSFVGTMKKMVEEYYDEGRSNDASESKMVGLSDVYNKVKEELVRDLVPSHRWLNNSLVILVGMAGIGKTFLAQRIFEDLDIVEWFDYRVWVTMGIEFESEDLQAIAEKLSESLRDKRYLIVLDDVWDVDIDNLLTSFPNSDNASRIVLTTRFRIWRNYLCIEMRLLDKNESWYLLRDKVFGQDGSCSLELEQAGKKIAEKCDGLPLTIVTVAEHLLKAEMSPEVLWNEVASHKKHQLFADAYDEISEVLYPSYNICLPPELKWYFLYIGIFPLKFEIPKSVLINLLIAEDLVELEESQTLEESALSHLLGLSSWSFVMNYKTNSSYLAPFYYIMKTCGLHSSWWHFCQREARKTNFFHVLDCYDDGFGEVMKCQSRLSIHNNILFGIKDVHNSIEKNCASTAHSLLCLGPYLQYQLPICFGLKLLQKLAALNIRFYDFPSEVLELVKLRYLALTFNGNLPPSISKLSKLQFLIINRHLSIRFIGYPTYLPVEIWDLIDLKYLKVMGCDIPDLGDNCFPNLLEISGVSNGSCTKGVFERIPKLNKLGIRIELGPNDTEPLGCFDHIYLLNELQSLKCVIVNPECKPEVVKPQVPSSNFPLKLIKLSLSGMGYQWEDMSKIASLPYLKQLKLQCNAFRGPKWEIKENEFENLRILLIEDIDLVQLESRKGSLQHLVSLGIKHCYKLKEVCLGCCTEISKIEVVDCNPLIVKEIKKTLYPSEGAIILLEGLSVQSSWNS